jgi:DNA invertase Pin-like site-specific DNA recombinase
MRAAIYARVSTLDQEPENQLRELRRYTEARGWTGTEFIDRGVSGAKDKRPALDGADQGCEADGSTCWSADGWTVSVATFDIW